MPLPGGSQISRHSGLTPESSRAYCKNYAASGAPESRPGKRRFGIHCASEQSAT